MSVIGEVEQRIRERMKELEPLIEEYRQLEALAETFERGRNASEEPRATKRRPRTAGAGRGHGAGHGNARREQALALVHRRPGITVAEIAEEMSIGTTYLYRVMPALQSEGRVRKVGRGYEPAEPKASE